MNDACITPSMARVVLLSRKWWCSSKGEYWCQPLIMLQTRYLHRRWLPLCSVVFRPPSSARHWTLRHICQRRHSPPCLGRLRRNGYWYICCDMTCRNKRCENKISSRVSKRLLDHSVKKVGNGVEPSDVAIEQNENKNQNDILGNGHLNLLQINPTRRGGVSTSSSKERHFTLGWIGESLGCDGWFI